MSTSLKHSDRPFSIYNQSGLCRGQMGESRNMHFCCVGVCTPNEVGLFFFLFFFQTPSLGEAYCNVLFHVFCVKGEVRINLGLKFTDLLRRPCVFVITSPGSLQTLDTIAAAFSTPCWAVDTVY